jgi:hypothetical protein
VFSVGLRTADCIMESVPLLSHSFSELFFLDWSGNGMRTLYNNLEANRDKLYKANFVVFSTEFVQFDEMAITHFVRLPSD